MPTKMLPQRADINHLKHQAKDLLQSYRSERLDAFQRIREFHPKPHDLSNDEINKKLFTLSDAQLTIAREYGFKTWSKLKVAVDKQMGAELVIAHHERITDPIFKKAVDLLDEGNVALLRKLLSDNPKLITQQVTFEGGNYFTQPTLLEFIAENPIRHGSFPGNIIEITKLILDAGADKKSIDETLLLVSSGQITRENNVQIPLINLLCEYGANPNHAMPVALSEGEFESVDALVNHGADISLTLAAATNRIDDIAQLLVNADPTCRQDALSLAAQFGHHKVVALLLNAGVDPNQYNLGSHSHTTPLHQAAWKGHLEVVRILVENGAKLDMRDIHHQATPLNWAEHAGRTDVIEFLKAAS
jgi:hypothetical protein